MVRHYLSIHAARIPAAAEIARTDETAMVGIGTII
jgi:hypothetical protein